MTPTTARAKLPPMDTTHAMAGRTALLSLWLLSAAAHAPAAPATPILALTGGARVRVAWLQDQGTGTLSLDAAQQSRLMVLDTREGTPRPLLAAEAGYTKPLITPDGQGVVYAQNGEVRWSAWDGSVTRPLLKGVLLELWRDPATQQTWVIYARQEQTVKGRTYQADVARCRLDDPAIRRELWRASAISRDNFQLSRDGRYAAALTPWPAAALLSLADQTQSGTGRGCWTSMCPDDSYIMWIFDGAHRNVTLFPPDGASSWVVNINDAEGTQGWEVYHPRWSNHPRYLVMTGPYTEGGGGNRIRAGGHGVELYLGRFSPDLRKVEAWVQVTHNRKADFFPDAWIEGGDRVVSAYPQQPRLTQDEAPGGLAATEPGEPALSGRWPATEQGLVYVWENLKGTTQVKDADGRHLRCEPLAWGRARFNRHFGFRLDGGGFEAPKELADRLLRQCQQSNSLTLEAIVTPRTITQTGPARIISFSESAASRNFTLGQSGDTLVLRLRTPATGSNGAHPEVPLCRIEAGKPLHLVVTYRPDELCAYVNGRSQTLKERVTGDFSNWSAQHLLFGHEATRDRNWDGDLQGVALYARFVSAAEAAHRYALQKPRIAAWKPAARFEATGTLISASPLPVDIPAYLGEYSRALRSCVYTSDRDFDDVARGERFIVRHWSILDRKLVPYPTRVGQPRPLLLERTDDHPEISSERLLEDLDEEDMLLPTYLAIEE